jgi:ATP-binding protein involved in chromosome partitioning
MAPLFIEVTRVRITTIMAIYPKMIMEALATVTYAGTKKNLVESGMVADQPAVAQREDGTWKVTVVLEFPRDTDPFLKSTVKAAEAAIKYHCTKASDGAPVEVEIQLKGGEKNGS